MSKFCPVCENKLSGLVKFKVIDSEICGICSNLCASYQTATLHDIQTYWSKNNDRVNRFVKSTILKSFLSDCIVIDNTNKLFYIGKKESNPTRLVYSFDEVYGYEFKEVGGKVVTRSKGGVGRAVVGGALFGGAGAIVGATTSKKETKTEGAINMLQICFSMYSGKSIRDITPPMGATEFFEKCIENQTVAEQRNVVSDIDMSEVRKFKELFDNGIITKDEFDKKKKQILGL